MGFKKSLLYLNLSQAQFAREIGISPEAVSRWKGKPPRVVELYIKERLDRRDFLRRLLVMVFDELKEWES